MPAVSLGNLGQVGIIKDENPFSLPINALTDGQNIRALNGAIETFQPGLSIISPLTVAPTFYQSIKRDYALYSDATNVYLYTGGVHTLINGPSGPYASDKWDIAKMDDFLVMTQEQDLPQALYPLAGGSTLVDLPNWPVTYRAKVMASFKNHLIAGSIQKGTNVYPTLVKWSHPADPGSPPVSWDETDPTKDAGEFALSEEGGEITNITPLGDSCVVYKDEAAYIMRYIGPPYIFSFHKLHHLSGTINNRTVTEFKHGAHFVVSDDDVVVHNGNATESVLEARMRRWLFEDIDPYSYLNMFTYVNPRLNECVLAYPSVGSTYCNRGLVWKYKEGACTIIDLPNVVGGGYSDIPLSSLAWDAMVGSWDTISGPWNDSVPFWVVMASNSGQDIKLYQDSNQVIAGASRKMLERTGWAYSLAQNGPYPNQDTVKYLASARPRITGLAGAQLTATFGSQEVLDGPITWGLPHTFTIGQDRIIDSIDVSGVYLAYRFESNAADWWRMTGLDLEVKDIARY